MIIDITLQTYKTVLAAFVDRQEKLRLATVYEKLSKTDPLTGIDNRVTLKANLDALLKAGNTDGCPFSGSISIASSRSTTRSATARADVVLHAVAGAAQDTCRRQGHDRAVRR